MVLIGVLSASESAMFSAAVSASNNEKCWNTMPMPSLRATLGLPMRTGFPFQRISPENGSSEPKSIFTSVDLPAPFSPSNACISPLAIERSMESQALSLPKILVRPRTSSRLAPDAATLVSTSSPIVLVFPPAS
jgi:hypothetical protein